LAGLDHRERAGYERLVVEMTVLIEPHRRERVPGLVYIAGPDNDHFLGPAPVSEIARQIALAVGPSGANPEYVFELARSLREIGAEDEHVFAVEAALAKRLGRRAED
jgi:cation transport regulator ChaC